VDAFYFGKGSDGMTWLSFFIGYSVGTLICLIIMIQFLKAKEVDKRDMGF